MSSFGSSGSTAVILRFRFFVFDCFLVSLAGLTTAVTSKDMTGFGLSGGEIGTGTERAAKQRSKSFASELLAVSASVAASLALQHASRFYGFFV